MAQHRRRGRGGVSRSNTRKFPTVSVQGPGSYVSFYKPKWAETREATEELREIGKDAIDVRISETTGKQVSVPREGTTVLDLENRLIEFVWDLAVTKFHEWNWLDDEGEPLPPLPEVDPEELYSDELEEIVDNVRLLYMLGKEEDQGN